MLGRRRRSTPARDPLAWTSGSLVGSTHPGQVDPEQPRRRAHPHRVRAGRQIADRRLTLVYILPAELG